MATYKEMQAQLHDLHLQAEQARLAEKAEVLDQIRALIVEHKLMPNDLGLVSPGKRRSQLAVAKYRDPATGATRSGRGRAPKWLQGVDRAQFDAK